MTGKLEATFLCLTSPPSCKWDAMQNCLFYNLEPFLYTFVFAYFYFSFCLLFSKFSLLILLVAKLFNLSINPSVCKVDLISKKFTLCISAVNFKISLQLKNVKIIKFHKSYLLKYLVKSQVTPPPYFYFRSG